MATVEDAPDAVDLHVGRQVRSLRRAAGLTQTQLGRTISVTFQQVQKYERGANRVSASMLSRIAAAVDATEADFFPSRTSGGKDERGQSDRELAGLYAAMTPATRRLVMRLVRDLARQPTL